MAEHNPGVVIWGDGGGSTFRATVDAIHDGIVDFDVTGVITTDKDAGILEHVKYANSAYGMDIESLVVEGRPGRRQDEDTQGRILDFVGSCAESLVLMGAMVIMGELLVEELNGDVPDEALPRTFDEARQLMVPDSEGHGFHLPADFPRRTVDTGRYGLTNTHPAPTVVTANTHGFGAHERMVRLRANESAPTYHVVGKGIDTGPIIAAHRFPIDVLPMDASEEAIKQAAGIVNQRGQRIEKAHLPLDVAMQALRRAAYIRTIK